MNKEELRKIIDDKISKDGIKMNKKLQSAYYGLFSSSEAVYDNRVAYSYKQAVELTKEGFSINDPGEIAILLINAIMTD